MVLFGRLFLAAFLQVLTVLDNNEAFVGDSLQKWLSHPDNRREDLFLVSKIWPNNARPENVRASAQQSLRDLKTTYVDLMLIHYHVAFRPGPEPFPLDESGHLAVDKEVKLTDTWHAMEQLVRDGLARSIGVSNFSRKHIEEILVTATIAPVVNQIEVTPYWPEDDLVEYCREKKILVCLRHVCLFQAAYFPFSLGYRIRAFWFK